MSGFFGFIGPAELAESLDVDAVSGVMRGGSAGRVAFSTSREAHSGFVCMFLDGRSSREETVAPRLVGFDGPDRAVAAAALAKKNDPAPCSLPFDRLRGGFALAAWVPARGRLLLARDRSGLCPLYYARTGKGGIAFASEIRALLASGVVSRRVSWAGVAGYLHLGVVPENLTLLSDVRPVPPGHCLTWVAGRVELDLTPIVQPDTALDPARLRDAIEAHVKPGSTVALLDLAGTGPCAGLSGIATEAGATSIVSLSLGRVGPKGIPNVETRSVAVGDDDAEEVVRGVIASFDQPCADGISSWLLAREASAAGADIAITTVGRGRIGAEPPPRGLRKFNEYMHHLASRFTRSGMRSVFSRSEVDDFVGPLLGESSPMPSMLLDDELSGIAIPPWYAALPQMTAAHGVGLCDPHVGGGAAGDSAKIDAIPAVIPLDRWLTGPLHDDARNHLFALSREGILMGDPVRRLWRAFRHSPDAVSTRQLWALVVLGAWINEHKVHA